MSSRDNLARNLRLLRAARGMSQEALAHEAGIHRTYVSALERCEYSASVDRLDRLAVQLKVPTYVLLMDELPSDLLG
ncbi:XRE family transcriptional regulator [Sphingobium sp. MI1205]|nr:XRE family transcriptional regulator [Sphingobium sp. MI1205]